MKNLNLLKNLSFTIFFISIFYANSQGQFEANVWATISDPSDVPFINAQGQLFSNNIELNEAIILNWEFIQLLGLSLRLEKLP